MRRTVAFAILASVLVITGVPAAVSAYTGDKLVVGSQHSTDTDFNNAQTLTNLTVSGSGEAASVTLDTQNATTVDGFEDGDIAEWSKNTGPFDANQSKVHSGSYSVRYEPTGNFDAINRGLNTTKQYDTVSWWVNDDDHKDIRPIVQLKNDSTIFTRVGVDDGTHTNDAGSVIYYNGSSWLDTGIDITTDSWYRIRVTNIDYANDEFDIVVHDDAGKQIGSASNLENNNPVDNLNDIQLNGKDGRFWIDDITTGEDTQTSSALYESSLHNVSDAEEAAVNITKASNVSINATVRTGGGAILNQTTLTSTGNHSLILSSTSGSKLQVVLNISKTGDNPAFDLGDESILFTNQAPNVANSSASPQGGTKLTSKGVTLEINASDAQFGTAQGESLTVTFQTKAPGESSFADAGTDTLTSNGTASLSLSALKGGTYEWRAIVTDEYGGEVTSDTFSFQVPANLTILNETDLDSKVTGASVEVRFFAPDTIVTRNDSDGDGNISLEGLPADEQIVVVVEADGYYNRHVILDSLYQQGRIFMLNKSETAYDVRFVVDDPTGQFPPSSTQIFIEKAITINGTTKYRVVAGDESGVKGFTTTLAAGSRYRIKVRNGEGDVRVLGAYDAVASESVTLKPVALGVSLNNSSTYEGDGYYQNKSGPELVFEFVDGANQTEDLTVQIYEQGNKSNAFPNETVQGPLGQVKLTEPLTVNQSEKVWVIKWTADRNGRTIGGQFVVGQKITEPWQYAAPWVLEAIAFTVTILVGALFSQANFAAGGVVTGLVAGGFWWMGMLPAAAGGAIVVGLAGATVFKISRGGQ